MIMNIHVTVASRPIHVCVNIFREQQVKQHSTIPFVFPPSLLLVKYLSDDALLTERRSETHLECLDLFLLHALRL